MSDKIKALFGCQIDDCAAECSYHADMLRLYDGAPICEGCYTDEVLADDAPLWSDLQPITLDMVTL